MRARLAALVENARTPRAFFWALLVLGTALLDGCAIILPQTAALRDAWPATLPEKAELVEVPFFPQEEYQCGPAALATVMVYAGARVTPDELVPQVYIPERKGTLQVEMLAAARRQGLVSYALAPRLEDVLREVASGTPVVVLHGYGVWPLKYWHYSVVVGFDRTEGEVLLRSGTRQRQTMPFAVLEYTWKESERWAMVATKPRHVPATAEEGPYLEAVNAMARLGDVRAAAAAYGAFLERWPDNVTASVGLAVALHGAGELRRAEAVLRAALARHADSVVLLNNLAQTLSDQGRHREALAFIDRAAGIGGPFAATVEETRRSILRRLGR